MATDNEALLLSQVGYLNISTAQPISKQTLGGTAATVSFSGIPQTYSSLLLIVTAQSNGSGATGYAQLTTTWNAIATGYNLLLTSGTVGSATVAGASLTAQTNTQIGDIWNGHFATAGSGRIVAWFPNYSETTFRKIVVSTSYVSDGGTTGRLATFAGANTTAITGITAISLTNSDASSFITGSVFEVIGIP
jgi:hypothetical protein